MTFHDQITTRKKSGKWFNSQKLDYKPDTTNWANLSSVTAKTDTTSILYLLCLTHNKSNLAPVDTTSCPMYKQQ